MRLPESETPARRADVPDKLPAKEVHRNPTRYVSPEGLIRARLAVRGAAIRRQVRAEVVGVLDLVERRTVPWFRVSQELRRVADRVDELDDGLVQYLAELEQGIPLAVRGIVAVTS